ncbi:MAG: autoinducer binding domain-containing protein [Yoonia sp.]|nr:autoinducer binding domain-containing protein [Yoonia sp.]
MADQLEIHRLLEEVQKIATAGFALAFHVRFTTPTFLFQTYASDWLDHYSQNGFVMSDPTVAWGFENTGAIKWSELAEQDTMNVLTKAAEFGLKYGTACGVEAGESRSLGSFARADREFDADETKMLVDMMTKLHMLTANIKTISPETNAALRTMSVQFTHSR